MFKFLNKQHEHDFEYTRDKAWKWQYRQCNCGQHERARIQRLSYEELAFGRLGYYYRDVGDDGKPFAYRTGPWEVIARPPVPEE